MISNYFSAIVALLGCNGRSTTSLDAGFVLRTGYSTSHSVFLSLNVPASPSSTRSLAMTAVGRAVALDVA